MHVKVAGTWQKVSTTGLQVKVSGTWRNIKEGWVKVAGTWRKFHQSFDNAFTVNSGAGDDGIPTYRAWGYADVTTAAYMGLVGSVGNVSPGSPVQTGGKIIGFIGGDNQGDGTTTESRLYCIVRGFSSDPGAGWLTSIRVAGTEYTDLTYVGYDSGNGTAQWYKMVNAGFKGTSRVCELAHS